MECLRTKENKLEEAKRHMKSVADSSQKVQLDPLLSSITLLSSFVHFKIKTAGLLVICVKPLSQAFIAIFFPFSCIFLQLAALKMTSSR